VDAARIEPEDGDALANGLDVAGSDDLLANLPWNSAA